MRNIIIIMVMIIGFSVMSFAGDTNDVAMITEAEMNEVMQIRDDCYKLIQGEKMDEALAQVNKLKSSYDKADIYSSIGFSTTDKAMRSKVVGLLESIKQSDETMAHLQLTIDKIKVLSMSDEEKVRFFKSTRDLSILLQLFNNSFEDPKHSSAVLDHIANIMPKSPDMMTLNMITSSLSISNDPSLADVKKTIISKVINKSKKLSNYDQVGILIPLANSQEENSKIKKDLKGIYDSAQDLSEKVSIGTQLCFNQSLEILSKNDLASLENQINSADKSVGINQVDSLFRLAECQNDINKMKQIIAALPEEEKSMYYIPEPVASEGENNPVAK